MNLNDRFIKGLISGVASGIVHDFLDIISNLIKIDKHTYFDWAGIVLYGKEPKTIIEYILTVSSKTFLTALLGILFAYLIPKLTSKNLVIKGGIFGLTFWAIFFTSVYVFKIDKLMDTNAVSALSDGVNSIVFGIVLALVYRYLDNKQKLK